MKLPEHLTCMQLGHSRVPIGLVLWIILFPSAVYTQADTYFQLGQPEGWLPYENYCHRGICTWNISTEVGRAIVLSVDSLHMFCNSSYDKNDPLGCACASLEIFDGSEILSDRIIYRKCFRETKYPGFLTSTANNMIVVLRYNNSNSNIYFTAFYKSVNSTNVVRDCGGSLSGLGGNLSSPGYPNSYSNLLVCEWNITVESPYKVWLDIQDMDIEWSSLCQYDSLQIFDGNIESSVWIAPYCTIDSNSQTYISENTNLFIKFVTNWNVTQRGFKARWMAVCGKPYYTGGRGNIQSPVIESKRQGGFRCNYIIKQAVGFFTRLTFLNFTIGVNDSTCLQNYIEVKDGDSSVSPILGRRFCGQKIHPIISSNQANLWIEFVSDGLAANDGFNASYIQTTCKDTYLSSSHGNFTSPLYPNNYSNNLDCLWIITAGVNNAIQLDFLDFALGDATCTNEWVEICDDDVLLGKYCGTAKPPMTTSKSSLMRIYFRTFGLAKSRGFFATYVIYNPSSECPLNYYGYNCTQRCDCSINTLFCDKVNGTCKCKAGWEGMQCEMDIDECTNGLHNCTSDHFQCINTNGSYRCDCVAGYMLSNNGSCTECPENYYGNNCNQTCNCSNNTLLCGNVNGTCKCKAGWEGVQCEMDINECTTGLHNCTYDHVKCTNTNGSYRCDCVAGYVHSTNASCTECPPHYYGENCNQTCICSNNTLVCDNVNGTCKCKAGWEGIQCELDINECTTGLHNCTYDHANCTNTNGSYRCDCLAGYVHSTIFVCAEADTIKDRPIAIVVAPIIVGVALIGCAALLVYGVRKYKRRSMGDNVNISTMDIFLHSFNGDECTVEYTEINHASLGDHDKDGCGISKGDNQNLMRMDIFPHSVNRGDDITEEYAEIIHTSLGDHDKEGSATIPLSLDYGQSATGGRVKDKSNIGTFFTSAAKDTEKTETVPSEDANVDKLDKMKESKPQICRTHAHSDTSGKTDYLHPMSTMPLLDEVASPESSVSRRPEEEDKNDYYLHPISNDSCL